MTDQRSRLITCFLTVFPKLHKEEIPRTSMTSVDGWDSIATVTLLVLIEEEFSIEIKPEDLEYLVSFELILDYLKANSPTS